MTAAEYQRKFGSSKPANKYKNKTSQIGEIKFASNKERKYYQNLQIQKQQGLIRDFAFQVRFEIIPKAEGKLRRYPAKYYIADFIVTDTDGTERVIDTKGVKTKDYILKRHLFMLKYGKEIIEV